MSNFLLPRITEKKYLKIDAATLTANSTVDGTITIASTYCFKVGQVVLFNQGAASKQAKIKRVISPTQFIVIDKGESVVTGKRLDMSAYLIGATVEMYESHRPKIEPIEIIRAVYEEEPASALRSHLVDYLGRSYGQENPLPIKISDVKLETDLQVQLSHLDAFPDPSDIADSIRIGDGVTEIKVDPTNQSFSVNTYEKILPLLSNAKWLELINYEEVTTTFVGNVATLSYIEDGSIVAKAIFTFITDTNWGFKLESYINDENGDILLDDDGTPLFLD